MIVTFRVTFVVIGNCIEEANGIKDFQSLGFQLLCKSCLVLMDTYRQVQFKSAGKMHLYNNKNTTTTTTKTEQNHHHYHHHSNKNKEIQI